MPPDTMLRQLLEQRSIGGKNFSPLSGQALLGFRLLPGPVSIILSIQSNLSTKDKSGAQICPLQRSCPYFGGSFRGSSIAYPYCFSRFVVSLLLTTPFMLLYSSLRCAVLILPLLRANHIIRKGNTNTRTQRKEREEAMSQPTDHRPLKSNYRRMLTLSLSKTYRPCLLTLLTHLLT